MEGKDPEFKAFKTRERELKDTKCLRSFSRKPYTLQVGLKKDKYEIN